MESHFKPLLKIISEKYPNLKVIYVIYRSRYLFKILLDLMFINLM